jgi:CubicO group peptidase (beta-lactamase class C family)
VLQVWRQRARDLADVESAVDGEEELVVRVKLGGQLRRQRMEGDKLLDLVALGTVACARRVELGEQLRDVAEDGGIQARAHDLARDGEAHLSDCDA